jgi:hypothetical protein
VKKFCVEYAECVMQNSSGDCSGSNFLGMFKDCVTQSKVKLLEFYSQTDSLCIEDHLTFIYIEFVR